MRSLLFTITLIAIALSVTGCTDDTEHERITLETPQSCTFVTGTRTVCHVSIYALITKPKMFADKEVLVSGYLAIDSGWLKLWPSKESFEFDLDAESIWIDMPHDEAVRIAKDTNRTYVSVVGVFRYTPEPRFGIHSSIGALTDVYRIFRISKRVDTPLDREILMEIPSSASLQQF